MRGVTTGALYVLKDEKLSPGPIGASGRVFGSTAPCISYRKFKLIENQIEAI